MANFAKVVKFKPDGSSVVTGSDDLFLRFFTFGICPDGTNFDNYGRCVPKSYVVIYIALSVALIVIIGIVIFFFIKKRRIPA